MPVVLSYHRNTWPRTTSCISFIYIRGYSTKIEHSQIRSLWHLLCHNKMKLLSQRIWHHHAQWQQTLLKVLNGKNVNNKVNQWSLELATYNITFEWISSTSNKTADHLSWLIEVPNNPVATSILINTVAASTTDSPADHNHNKSKTSTDVMLPDAPLPSQQDTTKVNAPLHLMEDCKDFTLPLMQRTYPFCKCISKQLISCKEPHHKVDTFTHSNSLLYEHAMDTTHKFLALVIPKSWHLKVLIKAYDTLGHQGVNRTYHFIKQQYYHKGMNKDIHKYIKNYALCKRKKAITQMYPLQMMEIPDHSFNKVAIDLFTDVQVSSSGNHHILIIINHLTEWPEALDENSFKTAQKTAYYMPPGFQVRDRVYFKNKQSGNWDLKWRARYRIVCIEHNWHYLHIENQAIGETQSCNVKDVHEPPVELWNTNT